MNRPLATSARRAGAAQRWWMGGLLWIVLFLLLNANGREIGNFDSQPAKFAARELALHGTPILDRIVAAQPLYANRSAFVYARDGHWRNAYSAVPVLEAAAVGVTLATFRLLDLEAPGAPAILAKLTASLLISTAGVFCFLTARRVTSARGALLTAVGFVLGTGLWPTASQTLWQHESAVAALMAAVWMATEPVRSREPRRAFGVGVLLAIAGASRPQIAPGIACLSVALLWRAPARTRFAALLPLAAGMAAVLGLNYAWFGTVLGALPALERVHPQIHGVTSSLDNVFVGLAGLLVSANRGLLVFSPVVLVALLGLRRLDDRPVLGFSARSCGAAALVQLLFYSCYSVWWGGHTYGPRYCLDLLPLLVPAAAHGVVRLTAMSTGARVVALAALCWSLAVAATGAFVYPTEMWNIDPLDVDRRHERLWDWRDTQIARCWTHGPAPQNFELFRSQAWVKP